VHPASPRSVFAVLAVVAVVAVTLPLTRGPAVAAEPDRADIEAQIDQLWRETEPMIERYNLVHEEFERNQARQAQLAAEIQPLADELAQAQQRIGRIAAHAYMGGQADTVNAMLAADSTEAFVDQMLFLESFSHSQNTRLSDVLEIKARYDAQKAPIDVLVADLAVQDAELAVQRADIESRIERLQRMRAGTFDRTSTRPWACPSEYQPTKGYRAAAFACAQIGKRYVFGTSGPSNYDCSGLTLRAWKQVGVYMPHNAAMQRRSMKYVSRAELQIGDLVFYYDDLSHVAIYVGDGKVVHAPRSGDVVRMVPMVRGAKIHSYGRP
jgi:hypothetical protein